MYYIKKYTQQFINGKEETQYESKKKFGMANAGQKTPERS